MGTIDWDALGEAQDKFTIGQQHTLSKYIHGWLPTSNHMEHCYKIQSKGPHYKESENNPHLTSCQSQKQHKAQFYTNLKQKLHAWNTEPGITRLLIQSLQDNRKEYKGWTATKLIQQLL